MSDKSPSDVTAKRLNFSDRMKAGLFLGGVSGAAATAAFCMTLAGAKKRDPKMFEKGTEIMAKGLDESGVELATRALKWGTFYAVTGTSLICYGIWKLSGAKSMEDFKQRMGKALPKVPKNGVPVGRTEFSGLNDLLTYVSSEYQKDVDEAKKTHKS